jgi:hypothetical protein
MSPHEQELLTRIATLSSATEVSWRCPLCGRVVIAGFDEAKRAISRHCWCSEVSVEDAAHGPFIASKSWHLNHFARMPQRFERAVTRSPNGDLYRQVWQSPQGKVKLYLVSHPNGSQEHAAAVTSSADEPVSLSFYPSFDDAYSAHFREAFPEG